LPVSRAVTSLFDRQPSRNTLEPRREGGVGVVRGG
jgi:hypothetical protein